MPWQCFVIARTDRARRYLRRFRWQSAGETHFHEARVRIEDAALTLDDRGIEVSWSAEDFRDDPRWPTHCACGYAFQPDDQWQVFHDAIYADDQGNEYTLPDAPTGAMWRCPWLEDIEQYRGPDGQSWALMLPPGGPVQTEWLMDGPATGGGKWQRTGQLPTITARPSIARHPYKSRPGYHGFLTDGVLSDDIEGRTYPAGG